MDRRQMANRLRRLGLWIDAVAISLVILFHLLVLSPPFRRSLYVPDLPDYARLLGVVIGFLVAILGPMIPPRLPLATQSPRTSPPLPQPSGIAAVAMTLHVIHLCPLYNAVVALTVDETTGSSLGVRMSIGAMIGLLGLRMGWLWKLGRSLETFLDGATIRRPRTVGVVEAAAETIAAAPTSSELDLKTGSSSLPPPTVYDPSLTVTRRLQTQQTSNTD